MAITKPISKKDADEFIKAAPDAQATEDFSENKKMKGIARGNKRQISLTVAPALLEKIDEMAKALGQTRAATINLAIHQAIERGFDIDGIKK